MIILELPIIFCKNYEAIEEAKELKLELPERDEYTTNCTFFIPTDTYIRITERNDRSTILIDGVTGEVFEIDADYQTAIDIMKKAIKNEP